MASDRSLEQLDISKLVLYVLAFIAVCAGLIIFLVIPILNDYKNALNELSSQANINSIIDSEFQTSLNRLESLKNENKALFEQFDGDFNLTHFSKFLNQYFITPTLSEIKQSGAKPEYLQYEFNVSATLESPKSFYEFIEALNVYRNLIELETPINLQSTEEGEISINFMLKIYSSRMR